MELKETYLPINISKTTTTKTSSFLFFFFFFLNNHGCLPIVVSGLSPLLREDFDELLPLSSSTTFDPPSVILCQQSACFPQVTYQSQ